MKEKDKWNEDVNKLTLIQEKYRKSEDELKHNKLF